MMHVIQIIDLSGFTLDAWRIATRRPSVRIHKATLVTRKSTTSLSTMKKKRKPPDPDPASEDESSPTSGEETSGNARLDQGNPKPSNRRKRPKEQREATVKMCLQKHLIQKNLLPIIDEMVDNVSRRVHRASLLLNHYTVYLLEMGELGNIDFGDQMLYNTALNIDSERGNRYPELRQFFSDNAELYEEIPVVYGSSRPLNSAARQMATTCCNHLWMNFSRRIERLFRSVDGEEDEPDARAMKSIIWRTRNMPQYVSPLALQERHSTIATRILDCGAETLGNEEITDDWIVENTASTLRFLYQLLQMSEERETKMFTMLPVFDIKRHHITIDGLALRSMLIRCGDISSSLTPFDFLALREHHVRAAFRLRQSWTLGNELKTDGVSLCVNVWRKKSEADTLTGETAFKIFGNDDYYATDPGEINLAATIHAINGMEAARIRLTRKQYREEGHLNMNMRKRKHYDAPVMERLGEFGRMSMKTPSTQGIRDYLTAKKPHDLFLWSHNSARKVSRWRMDTYIRKCSIIDRHWRTTKGESRYKPLMKYGAAAVWSRGMKKRESGPQKLMRHSCRKHFVVVDVDEFRTTKCCPDCHTITEAVRQRFVGPLLEGKRRWSREYRGLRRCRSNECRSFPLKSRDYGSALNIGACVPERPAAMCRG